jgi:hypothetical protein
VGRVWSGGAGAPRHSRPAVTAREPRAARDPKRWQSHRTPTRRRAYLRSIRYTYQSSPALSPKQTMLAMAAGMITLS